MKQYFYGKMTNESQKKAFDLLKDFIKKELKDKNINTLKCFSFWGIENKFFNNNKNYPDGDCTKIAYAISYLLYFDELPNFTVPFYLSEKETSNYVGDTINTFNTLFAKDEENRQMIESLFSKAEWNTIIDTEHKNNPFSDDYYHVYQRIGNFMVLPNRTLFEQSLNTYRGNFYGWKDYFYQFMENLHESYRTENIISVSNKSLYELSLLKKENSFFFDSITFDEMIEKFYLRGYEKLKITDKKYYNWKDLLKNRDIKTVLDFVENSKDFIKKRSDKLVEVLKTKYPELAK